MGCFDFFHSKETELVLPPCQEEFEYRARQSKVILKTLVINVLALIIIISLWQLAATFVIHARGVSFPTPLETFQRLGDLFSGTPLYGKTIGAHLTSSLIRWGIGYGLAVAIGLMMGMVLGASRSSHDIGMPAIYVLQLIPGLAWLPIALLIFGLGETATIFMIFMTALPPVIINTTGGIMSVPKIYTNAAEMMGLRRGEIFFKVMIPASMISITNGFRIGFANGWRVLIAAEMIVGVSVGLGYSLIQARWSLDFEAALACIVIICFIGLIIEKVIFTVIEKKVMEQLGLSKEH
jgi:ABC-type nitrate/sulfonate/bicarbonate transport system permease component